MPVEVLKVSSEAPERRVIEYAAGFIKRGQVISAGGDTGRSPGPHLHYEIRLNDVPINPKKFL